MVPEFRNANDCQKRIPYTYFNYDTDVEYYKSINAFKCYFRELDIQNVIYQCKGILFTYKKWMEY